MTGRDLFTEPFKPQWMAAKEKRVRESLDQATSVEIDFAWRRAAQKCYRRILKNHYSPQIPPAARKYSHQPDFRVRIINA